MFNSKTDETILSINVSIGDNGLEVEAIYDDSDLLVDLLQVSKLADKRLRIEGYPVALVTNTVLIPSSESIAA